MDYNFIASLNRDVFKQRDIIERFNRDYLPGLTAQAPQLPIAFRIGARLGVGTYDFRSASFPITTVGVNMSGGRRSS